MVSLGIFCYQINVALDNLMSKATVDSTEYIPISDLNSPPIITFCPKQAENRILLFKWGYFGSISNFLTGNYKVRNNCNEKLFDIS